jgi:NADH-quinone oxidoreductase subunit A
VATEYFPLLIMIVVAIGFAAIAIGLPALLGPKAKRDALLEPYESGIIPYHDARGRFPVKYYLVAMLFLLFDIEVLFTYPWAAIVRDLRDAYGYWLALAPMGVFLVVLVIGLIYEWRKGALDWND